MRCAECNESLAPGSRFCPGCGSPAASSRCAGCDGPVPEAARFCPQCGTPRGIGNPDVEPREDASGTTLVGVLVCEFMPTEQLSGKLDSADLDSLRKYFRDRCARLLERFDGEITRLVGNRLVAVFRATRGEDLQVERVLEAGLTLCEQGRALTSHARALRPEIGDEDLAVRVAAHAGRCSELPRDPTRAGETFDAMAAVAAESIDLAEKGHLVASQATLDLVPGLFVTQEIENGDRGTRASIVRQLSGVQSDRSATEIRSRTPFVAREVENALLLDRWRRVGAGKGRAILIRGEAGIGKSRLLLALREQLEKSRYSWMECQCTAEHRGSAFQPIVAFFEQIIGLNRNDPQATQLEQLETALLNAGFPIEETIPLFASLLGIEMPGEHEANPVGREELRRQTLDWLCEWVVRIARQQPTAVVVDDMHWSDPSTLDLVSRLNDLIQKGELEVLLLLAARNEFDPSWSGVEHIHLPRFRSEEIVQMANAVAGERTLPSVLTHEVSTRSEGIPLFIEEFTEDVLEAESHVGSGQSTIETSMLRRVARVTDPQVARIVSVVGQRCSLELLRRIAADLSNAEFELEIEKLTSAGILIRQSELNGEYVIFRHALVRDALYEDIDPDTLRELHERVARTLESARDSSSSLGLLTRPETIAQHFKLSNEPKRAIAYYQQAAQEASRISANAEAVLHLREALALLRDQTAQGDTGDPTKELELLVTLGPPLLASVGYGDPEVAEVYARAHDLCDEVSDPGLLFRALYGLSTYFQARGARIHSGQLAEECLALAERIGDPALKVLSHQRVGLCLLYGGEPERALQHLEQALTHYDPAVHRPLAYVYGGDMGVHSRAYGAMAYFFVGRPDRARLYLRAALADAREGGHQHTIGFALSFCSIVFQMLGDRQRALDLSAEGIRESERYGFALWSGICRVVHGSAASAAEETRPGSCEQVRIALEDLERIGSVVGTPYFYELYASALVVSGFEQSALDALTTALDGAEASSTPYWISEAMRVRGEIHARRGQVEEARVDFETAVETARAQGARSLELRAASSLERSMRSDGRAVEANALIGLAWERFAAGFDSLPARMTSDILRLTRGGLESTFDEDKALEDLLSRLPRDATHVATLRSQLSGGDPRGAATPETSSSSMSDLVDALTPRRLEVLRLVAKGLTNREIAGVLKISEYTAKAHVAGLLEALDLSNRTEAAVALREYEAE